jgi:hypothetical protein
MRSKPAPTRGDGGLALAAFRLQGRGGILASNTPTLLAKIRRYLIALQL